jgi:glycosyltransferase involved in cell wall biosynthesis
MGQASSLLRRETRLWPVRVVHLPSSYSPDTIGGTESFVASPIEGLGLLGVDSVVAVHRQTSGSLDSPGVSLPPYSPRSTEFLYAGSNAITGGRCEPPGFRELLRRWSPDVVHFHARTLGAGRDHMQVVREFGIPIVVTYHTPAQSCPRGTLLLNGDEVCDGELRTHRCARCTLHGSFSSGWLEAALSRSPVPAAWVPQRMMTTLARPSLMNQQRHAVTKYFESADKVVACADFAAEVLVRNGLSRERVTIIRQGLSGATRRRRLRHPRDGARPGRRDILRLGYFGRINHAKGVDLAHSAVSELSENGVSITCEYVGPVEAGFELDLPSPGGLPHRHLGSLRGGDLSSWIRSLDLVLVPSRGLETGPLTLLEAWDQEVPVIGADAGGIRDFMQANGQSHLLFDRGCSKDLARVIGAWIEEPSEAAVVEVPGMREVAAAYHRVYGEVVVHSG